MTAETLVKTVVAITLIAVAITVIACFAQG